MTNTQNHQSELNQRLFGNIGLNFTAQVSLLLINIATAPYIVHHLGIELFAIVALVQSVSSFSGVITFGIGRALTKYVSELYWKGEIDQVNKYFQTAWTACIVLGFAGIALLGSLSSTVGTLFFHTDAEVNAELVTFAIYAAAFGLFSSMLLEAISAIPVAVQRFGLRNIVQVIMGSIWCLGSVALLAASYSVRSILILNVLSNLVGVAAFIIASRSIIPGLKILPRFHWASFKKLLSFSLPLMLSAASAMIVVRLDRFLLAYYLPLTAVTFYTLPYSLSEKLSMAVTNVSSVVFPFTSELHAMSAHEKVHELYMRSTKILMLVTLPIAVVLFTIPGPVLQYWLGEEYAAQGATCLRLLSLGAFLNAVSAIPTVTSLGVGRAWMPSAFALTGSGISLLGNILLIPRYGIDGAALGLLASQVVVLPFVHLVNRSINLSSWIFFSESLMRPFACAFVQSVVLYESSFYINSLASLLVVIFISIIIFGLSSFFGALTHEERVALLRTARSATFVT
jgi:O-antigen/teichoic acid export membrane protein